METNLKQTSATTLNMWRLARWSAAVCLLLLPLIAMQFTEEVNWTASDFIFAAVLIGGTGLGFELALRVSSGLLYRTAATLTLGATFLLVWVNAAVGIIGNSANDANILYGLVVAIVVLSAIVGRFSATVMAPATAAAGIVQAGITLVAVTAGLARPESPALKLWAINGFFIVLWLVAAFLFRKSAAEESVDDHE